LVQARIIFDMQTMDLAAATFDTFLADPRYAEIGGRLKLFSDIAAMPVDAPPDLSHHLWLAMAQSEFLKRLQLLLHELNDFVPHAGTQFKGKAIQLATLADFVLLAEQVILDTAEKFQNRFTLNDQSQEIIFRLHAQPFLGSLGRLLRLSEDQQGLLEEPPLRPPPIRKSSTSQESKFLVIRALPGFNKDFWLAFAAATFIILGMGLLLVPAMTASRSEKRIGGLIAMVPLLIGLALFAVWLRGKFKPFDKTITKKRLASLRIWAQMKFADLLKCDPSAQTFSLIELTDNSSDAGSKGFIVRKEVVLPRPTAIGSSSSVVASAQSACLCCLGEFQSKDQVAMLPCFHIFCEDCITKWATSGARSCGVCPACRASFEPSSFDIQFQDSQSIV
jgi:hypothetical protein